MKPIVAKVGGSLFDLPDLGTRLRNWAAAQTAERVIFVPGGGAGADVIRNLDVTHGLGEEASHWIALHVLRVNAHFLSTLLDVPVVSTPDKSGPSCVLDALDFCRSDVVREGSLPHSWDVTSDTIAMRVAEVARGRLVLLKSVDLPAGVNWEDAAASGLVDRAFPRIVARVGIDVAWVNLRQSPV